MLKALTAAAAAAAILTGAAAAQSVAPYQRLAGTWTGEQVRSAGGRFAMVIEIKPDGSYTWTREGRFVTAGQLSGTGGALGYANAAGSRGSVQASGNRLVWKNIHTGNDYTVTVRK
jgi:hypothetical protein